MFVVIVATVGVFITPLNAEALTAHKPTGDVIGWVWVRAMTPIINIYAALFLVGGAMLSSYRFLVEHGDGRRALGTAFIALGGLLPGIGGTLTKSHDIVEALYVGEFVGIVFIWIGYKFTTRARKKPPTGPDVNSQH
jgi:hypothetical protein